MAASNANADSGRAVARAAAEAFGGRAQVHRFYDETEAYSVDLLTCADRPSVGFATYSTVSLHHAPNMLDDKDVRVEVAGVAANDLAEFPNLLATTALWVIRDAWLCAPGVVFPALVGEYELSATLEHVLWVPPFPWEQLGSVEVGDGQQVHWLLAIPISEDERRLLEDRGFDVLEALFAEYEIEYFDLDRPSIV